MKVDVKYCQVLSSWRIDGIKEVDDDDVSQHVKDDDDVDNDDDN